MKTFLVVFASLAVAGASVVQLSPTLYTAAIPITSQYHNQDSLGQYSYGYSGGPSTKTEYKSLDGVIRGSYSYVDADGELQTVEYTADSANGFQASATNLPKAPVDDKVAPKPVEDTPEVAMAKAEHLAAVREAELREAELGATEDPSNGDENGQSQQQQQEQKGSQEQQAAMSQESTSAETESPRGLDGLNGSNERSSQESESSGSSSNGNANGEDTGNGNENETGGNGITRLANNGLSNLDLNGISGLRAINLNSVNNGLTSSFSNGLTSLSLSSINANGQLTTAGLNELNSLQLNDALRFSEINPASTTQLRPLSLTSVQVPVPGTSYLRVSTPTHGYSIISPTVLTAVPTIRGKSSQTISRTLPLSLSSAFLTQGLH